MEQRKITVDMISEKEFQITARGYDQREVDEFLDDICDEMERMEDLIKELRQQNATVRPAPVVAAPVVTAAADDAGKDRIMAMLEMAARVKDETIAKAEEEAEVIRNRARSEADERIGDLSEEKAALLKEIENLKQVAADYRKNFESLLQAQQEALEKATDLF